MRTFPSALPQAIRTPSIQDGRMIHPPWFKGNFFNIHRWWFFRTSNINRFRKNSSERLDLETKSKEGKVGRVTWLAASKRQISPKKAIEKGWGGPKLTKKTATQVAPAKDRFDQLSCWYDLHSRVVSKTNKTLPYPLSQDAYLAAWQGGFPLKSSFP